MSDPQPSLASLLRQVLTNPHAEQAVRSQMITLASQNLYQPDVINVLLESLPKIQDSETKKQVLTLLMQMNTSRLESMEAFYGALQEALKQEKERRVREALLERLAKALHPSMAAKYPELVRLFCKELVDPGSPSRLTSAHALAGAAKLYPEIAKAFEDVLLHDQDRELVRTCLEAYLKPNVSRSFEVLLAVVQNELLDTSARQQCLDFWGREGLSSEERKKVAEALVSLNNPSLRLPS